MSLRKSLTIVHAPISFNNSPVLSIPSSKQSCLILNEMLVNREKFGSLVNQRRFRRSTWLF